MPSRPAFPTGEPSNRTLRRSSATRRTTRILPAVRAVLIAALWVTLPQAPAIAGELAAQPEAVAASAPSTCSAPSHPQTPDTGQAVQALRELLATRAANPAVPADRPIALNARGYNYGTPPDLASQLHRTAAEALAR